MSDQSCKKVGVSPGVQVDRRATDVHRFVDASHHKLSPTFYPKDSFYCTTAVRLVGAVGGLVVLVVLTLIPMSLPSLAAAFPAEPLAKANPL